MAQIETKLILVSTVGYFCGNCGKKLGVGQVREGMNTSKGKLVLYDWFHGRCPECKAILTKPEADDYTVADMPTAIYGTFGGHDAGSC